MGNMPKYLSEICGQKTFTYMGCGEVVMPENYIAIQIEWMKRLI